MWVRSHVDDDDVTNKSDNDVNECVADDDCVNLSCLPHYLCVNCRWVFFVEKWSKSKLWNICRKRMFFRALEWSKWKEKEEETRERGKEREIKCTGSRFVIICTRHIRQRSTVKEKNKIANTFLYQMKIVESEKNDKEKNMQIPFTAITFSFRMRRRRKESI